MNDDSCKFWRENVRPGTTFGEFSRQPTPWQKFYDWLFRNRAANTKEPK